MLGSEQRVIRDTALDAWARGDGLDATRSVTPGNASQVLTVFGCVTLISGAISTLPVDVQRTTDGRSAPVANPPAWVEQPNPEMDRVSFVETAISHLLLDGNAYLLPMRSAGGMVTEVWMAWPSSVQVTREAGRVVYRIDGRVYPGEVVHVRGRWIDPVGRIKGIGPVEAARLNLSLALNEVEHGNRYYTNGVTVPTVITVPGEMTREQAMVIRDLWVREHRGAKAWLPGVLTGGADVKNIGVNNKEAQFLEARNFSAAEIAGQLFLVDPSELGIAVQGTSLTYANTESRATRLARITFLPWMVRLERAFTYLLPRPQRFRFNVDGFLRAELGTRYGSYKIGIDAGFLTIDEARALEDLPPLPAGQPAPPASGGPDGSVQAAP